MKWRCIKRTSIFSNIFMRLQWSFSQLGATYWTETHWSKAQQWVLVWSRSRDACEEISFMEKLGFSHLAAVALVCMSWSFPLSLRPVLRKMVMVPLLSALMLDILWGGLKRRHCAVLSTAVMRCSWILEHLCTLTVWSYHHQSCDETSPRITKSQCFWWIKHKFIHMPWAFLTATVSQLVMFLRNGEPVVITCKDTASDVFVPAFLREKGALSCFLRPST